MFGVKVYYTASSNKPFWASAQNIRKTYGISYLGRGNPFFCRAYDALNYVKSLTSHRNFPNVKFQIENMNTGAVLNGTYHELLASYESNKKSKKVQINKVPIQASGLNGLSAFRKMYPINSTHSARIEVGGNVIYIVSGYNKNFRVGKGVYVGMTAGNSKAVVVDQFTKKQHILQSNRLAPLYV